MSIKPILFNTEMVRAIIAKKKTQTRIVNKKAVDMKAYKVERQSANKWNFYIQYGGMVDVIYPIESPVSVGDILWVREAYCEPYAPGRYAYRADYDEHDIIPNSVGNVSLSANMFRWKPSIHMPKQAARIFLRVTDVQVERLNEISQSDAIDEGALTCDLCETDEYNESCEKAKIEGSKPPIGYSPRERFAALWDSTIKNTEITKYGWYANPWVWVITFERCEKPVGWWEVI